MKVKFSWSINGVCYHCSHTERSDIEEYPDNITDEELEEIAKEYFFNDMEPQWWFEKLPELKGEKNVLNTEKEDN